MPFKRMTPLFLLSFLAFPAISSLADPLPANDFLAWQLTAPSTLASSETPPGAFASSAAALSHAADSTAAELAAPAEPVAAGTRLRKLLADFAVTLRDIRYRRGGHDPSTGFDCSGFVRYVFRHSLGQDLPSNSASQYRIGSAIDRDDMKIGDLVFFHIHGKRVSHVGIYLGDGRFIHSPSTGRTVSISSLDDAYWAKRFAGAKRPKVLS